MARIKFITGGANSAIGGFSAGDLLVCSDALAKHLIEEVQCARYDGAPKAETSEESKPLKRTLRERKD